MSSTPNTRRHRAGENPAGRPARELVDQYFAPAAAAAATVVLAAAAAVPATVRRPA